MGCERCAGEGTGAAVHPGGLCIFCSMEQEIQDKTAEEREVLHLRALLEAPVEFWRRVYA